MMYEGKCPHCGNTVRGGHGIPMKRIASPIQTCFRCGRKYIDENMYEWAVLNPVYKLWFYFGANNRGIVLFFSLLIGTCGLLAGNTTPSLRVLAFSVAWIVGCYIYVKLVHKNAMIESQIRCSNAEYLQLLENIGYEKME